MRLQPERAGGSRASCAGRASAAKKSASGSATAGDATIAHDSAPARASVLRTIDLFEVGGYGK